MNQRQPTSGAGRPLRVGLLLPTGEGLMAGETPHWPDLLAMARRAEELGYDSLWVPDHFLMRFPGRTRPPRGTWDCWTLLAALAATTERIEIGSLVSSTTFRNPALLAWIANTVDDVSGGRLILGVGAGDAPLEHEALGVPYDRRASRFEEAIQIITSLLRDGTSTFDGTFYQTRDAELRPRGPRPSGPPIMIGTGTRGPRMLRLAARYGEMWNAWLAFGRSQPDAIPPLREAVDAACRDVGRDPATLARSVAVQVDYLGREEYPEGLAPLTGSPEDLAEQFRAFAHEGINHIQVVLRPTTLETIERLAPVLELLDRG
jgi:alkanesulfonate monooxygenase SsuD/methylene tetrahydromethanopterin reductase-like flavin-dependent oxidoreductase (luciferase family)